MYCLIQDAFKTYPPFYDIVYQRVDSVVIHVFVKCLELFMIYRKNEITNRNVNLKFLNPLPETVVVFSAIMYNPK